MRSADPITLEALRFFRRPQGRRLLAQAADLAGDEWQAQKVLRGRFPARMCRAALALVQLRQVGQEKFTRAECMFFDRHGLEMASREEIARYRATRLQGHDTLLDLCCGPRPAGQAARRLETRPADRLPERRGLPLFPLCQNLPSADLGTLSPEAAVRAAPQRGFPAGEDKEAPLSHGTRGSPPASQSPLRRAIHHPDPHPHRRKAGVHDLRKTPGLSKLYHSI